MKKISRIILFLIVILIIAGGLLLFLFRHSVAEDLRQQIELTPTVSADKIKITPADALDTGLLSNARFTALVNHVINFSFDNICWRPGSDQVVSQLDAGNDATGTASTVKPKNARSVRCVEGNSAPFIAE
ncbi:MAG: hypothetical protein WC905_02040 [Patescibacteria group bacterium]|jgi:hypothetical protein